jgi:hypothetical protein
MSRPSAKCALNSLFNAANRLMADNGHRNAIDCDGERRISGVDQSFGHFIERRRPRLSRKGG